MEYSVNFENAINKIDEVFDSKELSLLSLLSLSSLQDDNGEEVQKEIDALYDKAEKAMRFVDIFRDNNIDIEDSESKEKGINAKIHDLIEEFEDLDEYNLDSIIGILKKRAK